VNPSIGTRALRRLVTNLELSAVRHQVEGRLDLQLTVTPPGKVSLLYCVVDGRGKFAGHFAPANDRCTQ